MAKGPEPPRTDVEKDLNRAVSAYSRGRFYEVESILYRIIWTMQISPDEHIQARTLLGNALRRMGRTAEAEKELRKALEISTAEGKASTRRDLMLSMGKLHFRKGDLDLANDLLKEAHDGAKEAGDGLLQGKALIDMGNVQIMLGNYKAAELRFQDGVKLIEVNGTMFELMRGLHNLAYVHFHLGDLAKAKEVLTRCLDLCRDAEPGMCVYVYSDLAHTCIKLGELDRAEELLKKAGEMLDRTGDALGRLNVRWVQGILMAARGDLYGALVVFEEVSKAIEDVGSMANLIEVILDYVPIMISAGRADAAEKALAKARAIVEERSLDHFKKRIAETQGLLKRK